MNLFSQELLIRFRRQRLPLAASLELGRVRRRAVFDLCAVERKGRWKTWIQAIQNLGSALWAHRLLLRNISEYMKETFFVDFNHREDGFPLIREFAREAGEPPVEMRENPLMNVREAASYLIVSPRVRQLQGRILRFVWKEWFDLNLTDDQSSILGGYSNAAWLSRGLLKASGVGMKAKISGEDKRRLAVVLEPYARTMGLRRAHLEGLSHPGRALISAWKQRRRLGKLRRSGFAPEDLSVLYPDVIDRETLIRRREAVVTLKKNYIMKIQLRDNRRRFENYLHLQTLISDAPARGPVRLGRFMAAVERRQV